MVNVVWVSYRDDIPHRGYWDQAMVEDLLNNRIWNPVLGYKFDHHDDFSGLDGVGAVVVVPGTYMGEFIDKLNADIAKLKWVLIIITSDEQALFPIDQIRHDNKKIWVELPHPDLHADYFPLGNGYTTKTRSNLSQFYNAYKAKNYDWYFAGQINNSRREKCAEVLRELDNGYLHETAGFSLGLTAENYYEGLANSKLAICPAGIHTPNTFRLFEALEAGCVPLTDELPDIHQDWTLGYWNWVMGEQPAFYSFSNYDGLKEYIKEHLGNWKEDSIRVYSWWQGWKRRLAYKLRDDIQSFGEAPDQDFMKDAVTVVIPTSPIPSHPSTAIIDEAIQRTRQWFPHSEILITIDGVRDEQIETHKDKYTEYIRELLWKCNFEYKNVLPVLMPGHRHQIGMMREVLPMIQTPIIHYVEHDTALTPDNPIDMENIVKVILKGELSIVRFHHEAEILDSSKNMMFDQEPILIEGVPFVRTSEWAQRPHLATTAIYRRIMEQNFAPDNYGMIEDGIYRQVVRDCTENGIFGWQNWRLAIYHPEGHIKRSYTTNGRGEDKKYDESYRY